MSWVKYSEVVMVVVLTVFTLEYNGTVIFVFTPADTFHALLSKIAEIFKGVVLTR